MTFEPCYDLIGIGLGPFNLALAALAEPVAGLRALFLDEKPRFSWHPGMMVDGATLQVPFLADLVTLVDPTNRHGYLAYLRDTGRLFEFYFAERFHVPRAEYESYCRSVAEALPACRFGFRVTAVQQARLPDGRDGFAVAFAGAGGETHRVLTANVVLGIGTEPIVPDTLRGLVCEADPLACHSAHYLDHAGMIRAADDVTVLGSGQSGAEVVLDLLRTWHRPGHRLRWLTRSAAFEPMEYSKLGLEHFTPDYTDYFHALPAEQRAALLARQGRLYKAVSADTLAAIRDELDARSFRNGISGTGITLMPGVEALGGSRSGDVLSIALRQ
ncbi:MAG TPA: SidA/IucD/PvdA family monooxygenase, partial [Actinospica sp.]|nr:SidA/IucD/PvdA family monooxygenase [Actinospica sp.]